MTQLKMMIVVCAKNHFNMEYQWLFEISFLHSVMK